MAVAGFVTNALNPTVPINMSVVSNYFLSGDGLSIYFDTAFGRKVWTFDTTAHASAAMTSLNTFVAPTAITN